MSITTAEKSEIFQNFATKDKDTGSSEVQIALLTKRIKNLTGHFNQHAKDFHSRTGLLKLVSKRRKLLDYLKRVDQGKYQSLISTLGLRR